jgi:hypothetical protein
VLCEISLKAASDSARLDILGLPKAKIKYTKIASVVCSF